MEVQYEREVRRPGTQQQCTWMREVPNNHVSKDDLREVIIN